MVADTHLADGREGTSVSQTELRVVGKGLVQGAAPPEPGLAWRYMPYAGGFVRHCQVERDRREALTITPASPTRTARFASIAFFAPAPIAFTTPW